MRIICAPEKHPALPKKGKDLGIVLYGYAANKRQGSVGASACYKILRKKLEPDPRAWDLLSIAFAVVAADLAASRSVSPDGWTRQLDLQVAVNEPKFWTSQRDLIQRQLQFLSTDIWRIAFLEGGTTPEAEGAPNIPDRDSVVLLSGGLDSLIGALDLVAAKGMKPMAVSQVSQGDKKTQALFASRIGGGLPHLQLNHNADSPGENERSQRSRSIVFLAYGVLAATTLAKYKRGDSVTLYVCENGFISINPPLTEGRIGSLSTRTTHPGFLRRFQQLLDAAGLRVTIENPYQFQTKGEMLSGCADQTLLRKYATDSTSCGRYARNGYKHCGRCLPCLIRRAAFHASKIKDKTEYVYADLSKDDDDHMRQDDVRSAAMGVAAAKSERVTRWGGPALSSVYLGNPAPYRDVVTRGLDEVGTFLKAAGVK